MERAFERDDAGLPGRLSRVLQSRLDPLRARVAEERPSAAEAGRQPRRQLRGRLRPVEVGDVPEALELRLGGGERCGVEVAEPDDGDSRDEVQVAPALVVDEPGALARDEG